MSSKEKIEEEEEKSEQTLELYLGGQYGSDADFLMRGRIDPRRMTRISQIEALVFPYLMEIPSYRGGRVAHRIVFNKMNLNMSIDGWNKRLGLKAISGSKGAPTVDLVKKPGWVGRNWTNRKWKEKAEMEGRDVVE